MTPIQDRAARLQHANADLRAEIELTRADLTVLENALADVTPLRRHVALEVRTRAIRVDERIRARLVPTSAVTPGTVRAAGDDLSVLLTAVHRADAATFASLAAQPTSSPALRAYERTRRYLVRQLIRVARAAYHRLQRTAGRRG